MKLSMCVLLWAISLSILLNCVVIPIHDIIMSELEQPIAPNYLNRDRDRDRIEKEIQNAILNRAINNQEDE